MDSASNVVSNLSLPSFEIDPYEHIDYLGHGAYGYVDKVRLKQSPPGPPTVYARKVVRINSSRDREYLSKSLLNEFKILNRLNHRHVVKVLQIYQWKNCLSIIMSQVAESNLAEYLQKVDDMELSLSSKYKEEMQTWPVCLIQALDYLHEMKVKHKDLKPANILILKGQVLIADFGISKDIIDEETTASLGASGDVGTRMYCAPEVLSYNTRRGRAADIYAMGCIFLEISTVLITAEGGLRKWSQRLEHSGSRLYSKCESATLRWIEYLFLLISIRKPFIEEREIVGEAVARMAFLMLDPDSRTRITARQMIQILRTDQSFSFKFSSQIQCREACQIVLDCGNQNLPNHSAFDKDIYIRDLGASPRWEGVKRMWLASHMWW